MRIHKSGTYAKVTYSENACQIIYETQFKIYSWNEDGERAQCMANLFTGHLKLQFDIKANGPTPLEKLQYTSKLHTLDIFDYKGNYLEDESLAAKAGIRVKLREKWHSPMALLQEWIILGAVPQDVSTVEFKNHKARYVIAPPKYLKGYGAWDEPSPLHPCPMTAADMALVNQSDLPAPYNTVKLRKFDRSTMLHPPNYFTLESLIVKHNVKKVIEIGTYYGASARMMADLLVDDGHVWAVDLYGTEGEDVPSAEDTNDEDALMWQKFSSNVIATNLTHKITPVRGDSYRAANEYFAKKGIKVDLIYVDGAHDYQSVVMDLEAYYPLLQGPKILCGDDWGIGDGQQVARAVKEFAAKHNVKYEVVGD